MVDLIKTESNIHMKNILLIILLLTNTFGLLSQNIEQAFVNIPDQYFPQLTKEKRSDLIYRHNVLKTDTITNNFKGISTLKEIDYQHQFLRLATTDISTFEEKIWIKKDSSKIIGFNHNVCGPVCDSHVAFFNTNFQRIDVGKNHIFPEVNIADFLNKDKILADGKTVKQIISLYDIFFTTIIFQKTENNIILESNVEKYLSPQTYNDLKPYLLGNKMELVWNDGVFKKGNISW